MSTLKNEIFTADIISMNRKFLQGYGSGEMDYKKYLTEENKQIKRLGDFITENFIEEIGKDGPEGAVDVAIRLLTLYRDSTKQISFKNER